MATRGGAAAKRRQLLPADGLPTGAGGVPPEHRCDSKSGKRMRAKEEGSEVNVLREMRRHRNLLRVRDNNALLLEA